MSAISQTTTAKLQEWAQKTGKTAAELETLFKDKYSTLPASVPAAQKEKRALQLVRSELTSSMKSPAVAFQGVILGASDVQDLMKKKREQQMATYQANPVAASNAGIARLESNGTVTLLDDRKEINGQPNKQFGKPLQQNAFVRRCIVAAKLPSDLGYKSGILMLRGDIAKIVPPMGQLLEFRALGDATQPTLDLRSSSTTSFTKVIKTLSLEEVANIIETVFAAQTKPLGTLTAYHATVPKGDYNSFVVTEGEVEFMKQIASEAARSDMMVVSDIDMPIGSDGITCWVPKDLRAYTNFGVGSIVTIFARTSMGPGYDREKKVQTSEQRLMLNILGIFPRPGSVTPPSDSAGML